MNVCHPLFLALFTYWDILDLESVSNFSKRTLKFSMPKYSVTIFEELSVL